MKLFRNTLGLFHLSSGFKQLSHILTPLLSRQEGEIIVFYLFLPFSFFQ